MKTQDRSFIYAIAMLMVAIISVQSSSSLAKVLFQSNEAIVVATMRLMLGASILCLISRIWTVKFKKVYWRTILTYGVALAGMNGLFYLALERLPLGLTVAFAFAGPLTVALLNAKQRIDLLWVSLSILGMILLIPFKEASGSLDLLGVFYALGTGASWATYILSGQKTSGVSGNHTVALGMLIGSCVLIPFSLYTGKFSHAFTPHIFPYFIGLAILASALPFTLEMIALKRLPPIVFGTLTSLDPVVAAISGILLLDEHLLTIQWVALFIIIIASLGCTYSTHRTKQKLEAQIKKQQEKLHSL